MPIPKNRMKPTKINNYHKKIIPKDSKCYNQINTYILVK